MKKITVFILILFLTLTGSAFALHDPDIPTSKPAITGSVSITAESIFFSRGRQLHKATAIQPSMTLNYGSLSFNFWQNNDSKGEDSQATESDLTVTYFKQLNKVNIVLGAMYIAGHGFADTTRIIASAGGAVLLNPTLTVFHDPDEGDGTFYVASVSHSIPVTEDIPLNMKAEASYNDGDLYGGTDDNGDVIHDFQYGQISASSYIYVYKNIFMAPNLNYSFPLSDKGKEVIRNGSENGDENHLYGGVTAGLSF